MSCDSLAVARGVVDVKLSAALINDPAGVNALVARLGVLLKQDVKLFRQDAATLYLHVGGSSYEFTTLIVHAGGAIESQSTRLRGAAMTDMQKLVELEVRKQGALSARAELIRGIEAAARAKNGRVVSNQRTKVDGRQLVLAV